MGANSCRCADVRMTDAPKSVRSAHRSPPPIVRMSRRSIPARLTVAMNGSVGAVRRFGRSGARTPLAVSHFRLISTFDGVLFSGMAIRDCGRAERRNAASSSQIRQERNVLWLKQTNRDSAGKTYVQ